MRLIWIIMAFMSLGCTDQQSVLKAKLGASRAEHAKQMSKVNAVFNLAMSRNISGKEFKAIARPITAPNILDQTQSPENLGRFEEVYAKRLTAYLQNIDYAPVADARVLALAAAPDTSFELTFRTLNEKFNHGSRLCEGQSPAHCFASWMIESEKISVDIEKLPLDEHLSYRQLLLRMMEQTYAK